jgi:hypothetical protein
VAPAPAGDGVAPAPAGVAPAPAPAQQGVAPAPAPAQQGVAQQVEITCIIHLVIRERSGGGLERIHSTQP